MSSLPPRALDVRPLAAEDFDAAAALVAARQESLIASGLPLVAPETAEEYCRAVLTDEAMEPVGAFLSGRLVGFLCGSTSGRFGLVPGAGHACASDVDARVVYAMLYGELARSWVQRGVDVHDVELPASPDTVLAWSYLGFGHRVCIASRPLRTLDTAPADSEFDVRVGTVEDLDVIAALSSLEVVYRATSPTFIEGSLDIAAIRKSHEALIEEGAVHLLAPGSSPSGLLTLLPEPRFAPLCVNGPFISTTAVQPSERGRGVGRALIAEALARASTQGHTQIGVSYHTPNLLSHRVWSSAGFLPIGWKMARRLPQGSGTHG